MKRAVNTNRLDFIPLSSDEGCVNLSNAILRPKEKKIDKEFFVLDTSPTPIHIDLSYLSSTSTKKKLPIIKAGNQSISEESSSVTQSVAFPHNNLITNLETNNDSVAHNYMVTNSETDDDIIYEGSKFSGFIGLKSKTSKNKLNTIQTVHKSSKRDIHTEFGKNCKKYNKKKQKNVAKLNIVNSPILDKTINILDSSIISVSESFSNKQESPPLINIDDDDDNELMEKYNLKQSSDMLNLSSETVASLSCTDNSNNDINNKSDNEEIADVENYEAISSASNCKGNNIEIKDANFVPLTKVNISDIEYCLDIPNKVKQKRYLFEKQRKWNFSRFGFNMHNNIHKPNGSLFTLLSYNVLSQKLLEDNFYLYTDCKKEDLDWSYRWNLLQYEIRNLEPDIMTFQEIEANHYYSHFLPWFTNYGYQCIYKKRTNDYCDGCAIVFNMNKFKLIEEVSVEYNQPAAGEILNRNNIGLIVKLTPKEFDSPFCIATTHLLYNPRRQEIRLAQLVVLLTELDRLCYKGEEGGKLIYCPIILTGDFNSDPFSKIYKLVSCGKVLDESFNNKRLLPESLGISNLCQHTVLEQSRYLENVRGTLFSLPDKRKLEEEMIRLYHTSRTAYRPKFNKNTMSLPTSAPSFGDIQHRFRFNSVYRNDPHSLKPQGVTTRHNDWLTVDYIFYTKGVIQSDNDGQQGSLCPLNLVATYSLLTRKQANGIGPLPCNICPSDHFPLAAQFLLVKP